MFIIHLMVFGRKIYRINFQLTSEILSASNFFANFSSYLSYIKKAYRIPILSERKGWIPFTLLFNNPWIIFIFTFIIYYNSLIYNDFFAILDLLHNYRIIFIVWKNGNWGPRFNCNSLWMDEFSAKTLMLC